jgi:broad specificity phosphatase PhoE
MAEWDYGEYEGLRAGEIKEGRKKKGLDQEKPWDIWRDGCEGGEYALSKFWCPLQRNITDCRIGLWNK